MPTSPFWLFRDAINNQVEFAIGFIGVVSILGSWSIVIMVCVCRCCYAR